MKTQTINRLASLGAAVFVVAFTILACCSRAQAQQYYWSNFVGTPGGPGNVNGRGSDAEFIAPRQVSVDGSGNVYVADAGNSTIRKVTSGGMVTTLAGTPGFTGTANGTGSAALFAAATGVAVDRSGNVYVADTDNNTIRKVTPKGVVTTLAGNPEFTGTANGTGSAARFYIPNAVAVDGSGNVYVAETNNTIRRVTPQGAVTTLAGTPGLSGTANGTGSAALFNYPYGIAVDGSGNIYVADTWNCTIRKMTPKGVVTTLAGKPEVSGTANGTGSAALFNYPFGVAVDGSGNVYVADTGSQTIRKVTPKGAVTTLAGAAGVIGTANGTGSAALFHDPYGVAVDGSGNVYVTDGIANTIRRVTPKGAVTTLAGNPGLSGTANGTGSAGFFNYPYGVAVDGSGNVYVADTQNQTIRKVTPKGVVTTLAGKPELVGTANGTGSAAQFYLPYGVAVDGSGNAYVADTYNHTLPEGDAKGGGDDAGGQTWC